MKVFEVDIMVQRMERYRVDASDEEAAGEIAIERAQERAKLDGADTRDVFILRNAEVTAKDAVDEH